MSERIPLDLLDPAAVRKRARTVGVGALMVAAAFGGLLGLLAGRTAGLVTAAVFAVPLLLLAWSEARRRVWLEGHVLSVRAFGTRSVDLHTADQLDLLVTDMRGSRTVGLFVRGGGKAINLALAVYAGTGGREQGVFALRKLADVLAGRGDAPGLVFSELLVAQLRAEARGLAAADRPLYQLGSLAPAGRLAQKLNPDAISRFVSTLD
ncbi:hypothetical protein FHS29_006083 [Saccharothrix tamanrassetensis]|uniref:Uncharacterized protein n=1 Tax=Saccharothrix tamanrassetensis TaxID=1051531 RepID=A0A841CLW4_9PSEU|nr:hypothetical protein [Saccharothrix tamanrassetensis]MBB5959462.1 hypothetical protein [Saccharothrix tamanrassetensis]